MPQERMKNLLHDAFVKALMKIQTLNVQLSDMYVQVVEGEETLLVIYDDNDNELLSLRLEPWEEWMESLHDNSTENAVADLLTDVVFNTDLIDIFNELEYNGPFSLLLVDSNMEVLQEILTIDKDNIVIGDEFWEKMDKELDEFYEKLMSDIKFR